MKTILKLSFATSIIFTILFFNGCRHSTEPEEPNNSETVPDTGHVIVRKPNIYLYPQTKCSLSVKIEFPSGGSVVQSIPEYGNGWLVEAEPNSKINTRYDYLFYESSNPDKFQYGTGWIVEQRGLKSFFERIMYNAGFNRKEINDFSEYWIPKLSGDPYYIIYPQSRRIIEQLIKLRIRPQPESLLRLFFVIKGSANKNVRIKTPVIEKFVRSGFTVTEWGVILK